MSMDKRRIDQLVGPSLFNTRWSNSKWTPEDYYRGPEVISTKTYRSKPKKGPQQEKKMPLRNCSRSSTPDHCRKSMNLDARQLIGVDFIANAEVPPSTSSFDASQPKAPKRNQRYSRPSVHYGNEFETSPRCQICNKDCFFYFDQRTRESVALCDCSLSKDVTNANLWKKGFFMWAMNYYFVMEEIYSFNNFHVSPGSCENTIIASPPDRKWIPVGDFDEQQQLATITTMSYNILCDKYVSSNLYSYCPSWALNWDYRKNLIMQQLKQHQADVIALQEVETWQYWSFFKPKFEALGYTGLFSARSRAKTMGDNEKQSVDGCALFWKDDKFELHREHVVEFTQLAIAKAEGSEPMLNRVMTRDNIALVAVLRIRPGITEQENGEILQGYEDLVGNPLIVCSTHIHWDPECCDVKLVQTMMLVQELNEILDQTAIEYDIPSDDIPLLLCGDLNSTEDSSVVDFIASGSIDGNHEDFKDFRGQACLQKLSNGSSPSFYSHNLQLTSAYDFGMLPFTNYTYDFKGVIDYIFASPCLIRKAVLGPMENSWQSNAIAFPNSQVPSDHIPLLAQYGLMQPTYSDQSSMSDQLSSD